MMLKQRSVKMFYPILLLFLVMNTGCATTNSMLDKVKREKPSLKKKIMVFPPIDHSGLPPGRAAQATENLVTLLKESPHLLFYAPPEDLSLPSEVKAAKFGVAYYNPELAEMAKNKNMNALMAAYMPPIEVTKGRGGIWPFRYPAEIFKISTIINVMDATNGCLFMTEFVSEEVALATKKVKGLKEEEMIQQAFEKAIPNILARQASAIEKNLVDDPWTGRILDVSKGVLKINAGKDVGICPDQLFTVYKQGESILCQTGRTVDLLGKKVGEIKTVSVMEDYSLAAPETGGPFSAGETIVFIPD